jgi:hypothetical protein
MGDIVTHISDEEECPEDGETDRISNRYHFGHEGLADKEGDYGQSGRINQSISKLKSIYGSLGSI